MLRGVYVSQHLSFRHIGKAVWENAMVANRTREIRPSGMKRGAWGNVVYGGNVNPPRSRKGGSGNPPPKGRRAPALSRPPVLKRIQLSALFNCNIIMDAITISPPIICKSAITSPKKILAITPAEIGSNVAVILAWVGRIRLMPSK